MPRYVAFLRGVSPMNASMPKLVAAFEAGGFTDVKTFLASGNVAFDARVATEAALERRAEAALKKTLGTGFLTIVRPVNYLQELVASDPYAKFRLAEDAKRVVTFLRKKPAQRVVLPVELDGARILALRAREVFTAYVRSDKGPAFMTLIEKTFGKELTTRTWDTVKKVAR